MPPKRHLWWRKNSSFLFSLAFADLKGITDLFCQNQKAKDESRYNTTENFQLITKDLMTAGVRILYFQWQRKCFVGVASPKRTQMFVMLYKSCKSCIENVILTKNIFFLVYLLILFPVIYNKNDSPPVCFLSYIFEM